MRANIFVVPLLLIFNILSGQSLKVNCIEKDRKNPDGKDPIIVKTCFLKNFKFKTTSYPDYVGRYLYSEHEVYVLVNKKYIRTVNSAAFNKNLGELVSKINERILKDFEEFSSDSTSEDCFDDLDSIPIYKMNDFKISFNNGEIWFEVNWGLSGACRAVDGTIIVFKLSEIRKYLK